MLMLDATSSISQIEYFYYISQISGTIVGTIILVVSILYAKKQYEYAKQQYESQKQHDKIIESAKLSRYFKENIISNTSILTVLFHSKAVSEICAKINLDEIELFSKQELLSIISEDELETILAALSIKICEILKNFPCEINKEFTFNWIMGNCANDLEYVCIHFNSGIAHIDTVYQSLHQTFFQIMPLLYIFISSQNTSEIDKYYTNIIDVYNEWRGIYKEKKIAENTIIAQEKSQQQCARKDLVVSPTKFK